MMTCLSDLEIIAFLGGDLPSETLRSIEIHLDACPLCWNVMAVIGRASQPGRVEAVVAGPVLANGEHRYVPGPEIARGGMGRILAGEDRLLGRPVALKLLRRSSASLARRFLREQRITARLQHPAIVPVYDAGVLDDGQSFFVMRLVKGQSLDRSAARAATLGDRLQLLPAVLGVVDAIAYAHGEGVVHRDLKPQNVLVGPFGEVVVLDWGLARELGAEAEPEAEPDDMDSGDSGDRCVTREGERLGTVAYMAPEQAEGQQADARSDVYGLGAILYHVLTARPPHTERTASLSTGAVLHAPPPIALRSPDVPPDLVAIVARAMAFEPEARYPSAQELAADLKRWQAGRLVEAHRYSLGELLRRFVHRYRGQLLVGAAALIVLIAVGSVGLWQIFAERGRALAAQTVAEEARLHAEDARALAEDARLAAHTQRVAAEKLVAFILDDLRPRLDSVGRLDVLVDVAREVMAYQGGTRVLADPEAWMRRAQATELAGDMAVRRGDLAAAEASYHQSLEAANEANDVGARCRAQLGLGAVYQARGNFSAAELQYTACRALSLNATDPELRWLHMGSDYGLAFASAIRHAPEARTLLRQGLAAAQGAFDGTDLRVFKLVVRYQGLLGLVLTDTGELVEARDVLRAQIALLRSRPSPSNHRLLVVGLVSLGNVQRLLGDLDAADGSAREALDLARLLVTLDPSLDEYISAESSALDLSVEIADARGDREAVLTLRQSLVERQERRVASMPDVVDYKNVLAYCILKLGDTLSGLGRLHDARRAYQRAIAIYKALAESTPEGPYRGLMGAALGMLGSLELKARRTAVGQATLQQGLDVLKHELAAQDTLELRCYLAEILATLAESERGPAARGHIEEAVEVMNPLLAQRDGNAEIERTMKVVVRAQRKVRAKR